MKWMNKKYIHFRKTQNKKQLMEDKLTQISHTNKRAGGRRNCEKTKHEERIQDKQHIKKKTHVSLFLFLKRSLWFRSGGWVVYYFSSNTIFDDQKAKTLKQSHACLAQKTENWRNREKTWMNTMKRTGHDHVNMEQENCKLARAFLQSLLCFYTLFVLGTPMLL